jgi:hypothetical protein
MAMTVQEAYDILSKLHGYTGPETKRSISNYINARDIPIAVKNRGGISRSNTKLDIDLLVSGPVYPCSLLRIS